VVSSTSSLKSVSNCCFCCEFLSHSGCYRSNGEAGDEAAAAAGIPYTAAIVLGGAASSNDNPQLVPHQPRHQSSCYCCWNFWVTIFLHSDLLLPITCLLTGYGNGDGGGSGILQFLRFRVLAWNWVEVFRESFPIPCCRKPEKLLDVKAVLQDNIPVIRRFSGGGTVIVDTDTVFVTLICRRDAVTLPDLYPRPIMEWTEHLYLPAFQTVPRFRLQEHGNKQLQNLNPKSLVWILQSAMILSSFNSLCVCVCVSSLMGSTMWLQIMCWETENLEAMLNQLSKTGFFIIHHSYGTIRTSGWHT
jgi:hypothetical protein